MPPPFWSEGADTGAAGWAAVCGGRQDGALLVATDARIDGRDGEPLVHCPQAEEVQARLALLTVAEASRVLKVHPNTVYELVRRRELPHVRVGRQIRFPLAAIEGWVQTQAAASIEPTSQRETN